MEADRWSRIDSIFHRAVERTPEERGRFLDEACCDDEGIREQIERLLAFDEDTPSFIDVPALGAEARVGAADPRVGRERFNISAIVPEKRKKGQ